MALIFKKPVSEPHKVIQSPPFKKVGKVVPHEKPVFAVSTQPLEEYVPEPHEYHECKCGFLNGGKGKHSDVAHSTLGTGRCYICPPGVCCAFEEA